MTKNWWDSDTIVEESDWWSKDASEGEVITMEEHPTPYDQITKTQDKGVDWWQETPEFKKLSDQKKATYIRGYPDEFAPLFNKAPQKLKRVPSKGIRGLLGNGVRYEDRTEDETFNYNYLQLSKDHPLRLQVDAFFNERDQSLIDSGAARRFTGGGREFVGALTRSTTGTVGALLARTFEDFGPIAFSELGEKLKDYSQETLSIQPGLISSGDKGHIRHFIANAVGDAIPYMAASLAGTAITGTPLAAFYVGATVEGDNIYDEIRAAGGTVEKAEWGRFIGGTINGAIETLQVSDIINFGNAGRVSMRELGRAASMRSWKAMKPVLKNLTYAQTQVMMREALEETLQEGTSIGMVNLAVPGTIKYSEGSKRMQQAALGGAVVGGLLSGAGNFRYDASIDKIVSKKEAEMRDKTKAIVAEINKKGGDKLTAIKKAVKRKAKDLSL